MNPPLAAEWNQVPWALRHSAWQSVGSPTLHFTRRGCTDGRRRWCAGAGGSWGSRTIPSRCPPACSPFVPGPAGCSPCPHSVGLQLGDFSERSPPCWTTSFIHRLSWFMHFYFFLSFISPEHWGLELEEKSASASISPFKKQRLRLGWSTQLRMRVFITASIMFSYFPLKPLGWYGKKIKNCRRPSDQKISEPEFLMVFMSVGFFVSLDYYKNIKHFKNQQYN